MTCLILTDFAGGGAVILGAFLLAVVSAASCAACPTLTDCGAGFVVGGFFLVQFEFRAAFKFCGGGGGGGVVAPLPRRPLHRPHRPGHALLVVLPRPEASVRHLGQRKRGEN